MIFSVIYFAWSEVVSLSLLFIAFIFQLYFYLRYFTGIWQANNCIRKNKTRFSSEQPPVSVIIAAKDEEKNLLNFLPAILNQNYPEFEVIVIDDASTDNTNIILDRFKEKYPALRTTFVPAGTKNISSKKLAITLGVKAAKYDLLLFTDADCYPESKNWIARMIRNFNPDIEFVLGYGAYVEENSFLNRLITYDTLFIAMQYMGMARRGKAYMGVGRNMAYRKDTFFRLKGFSSNLDILSGDDDLLVSCGSTPTNTAIEITPESLTRSEPKKYFKDWYYQKIRHLSSSVKYNANIKLLLGLEPLTRGLFYLAFIATGISCSLAVIIPAAALFLLRYAMQAFIVNKTSGLFDRRKYFYTLIIFDILLPLINLFIMLSGKIRKREIKWK